MILLALVGCGGDNTLTFEGPASVQPGDVVSSLWIEADTATGVLLMVDAEVSCTRFADFVAGAESIPDGTGVVLVFTLSGEAAWPGQYAIGGAVVDGDVSRSLVLARFAGGLVMDSTGAGVGTGFGEIETADAAAVVGAFHGDRADGRFAATPCAVEGEADGDTGDTGEDSGA